MSEPSIASCCPLHLLHARPHFPERPAVVPRLSLLFQGQGFALPREERERGVRDSAAGGPSARPRSWKVVSRVMSGMPSRSSIDRLGDRLRKTDHPTDEDLTQLHDLLRLHDPPKDAVIAGLAELGYIAVGRIKTWSTLLDKLKKRSRLSTIRDIAGTRIVLPTSKTPLSAQDVALNKVLEKWPSGEVIDRRVTPSFGYRAVHVEVVQDGFIVEIQIRTVLQHAWAQMYESLADDVGRQIRYGGEADHPDATLGSGITVRQLVEAMQDLSLVWAENEEIQEAIEGAKNAAEKAKLALHLINNSTKHESIRLLLQTALTSDDGR